MLMYLQYAAINIAAHTLLQKGAIGLIDFCKKSRLAEFEIGKILAEKFFEIFKNYFFPARDPSTLAYIAHEMQAHAPN